MAQYLPEDDDQQQRYVDLLNSGVDPAAAQVAANDPGPTPGANTAAPTQTGDIDLGDTSGVFGKEIAAAPPLPAHTQAAAALAQIQTERPVRPGSYVPGSGQTGDLTATGDTLASPGQVKTQGPGFWRNLAAIGAGLGAGYMNSQYPRGAQSNVAGIVDNIKFGGYNRKVEDWAEKENDAAGRLNTILKSENETNAQTELGARTNLQNAQAGYFGARSEHPPGTRPVAAPRNTIQQGIDAYAELHPDLVGPDGKLDMSRVPAADKEDLQFPTRPKTPPAVKEPHVYTSSDYVKKVGTDGKTHLYLPDPKNPASLQDMGVAAPEKADPMELLNARESAIDARADKRDANQQNQQISAADVQRQTALAQAEAKAAQKTALVNAQFSGTVKGQKKLTPDQRDQALGAIADELQKEKQLHQDAWESVYAQHGRPVQHIQYGSPLQPGPGPVPSVGPGPGAPSGPVNVTLPNGAVKVFPNQKAADAFKLAAGIR